MQATALQVDAINREQCEKTFTDKMMGKHFDRPEFVKMIAALAEFERDIIQESTLAGLEAARARGREGGEDEPGEPLYRLALFFVPFTLKGQMGKATLCPSPL